jgi:uncharacterized protein
MAIVDSGEEEAAASISLLLALHQINTGTTELKEDAIDELDAQAPDLIPMIVENLNAWTKSRARPASAASAAPAATAANANETPGSRRKVGRNDPCPCRSGRKYKRCCGAS